MILSALPFAFHYYIFSRKGLFTKKTLGPEVTVYLIMVAASVPIFYLLAIGTAGLDMGAAAYHKRVDQRGLPVPQHRLHHASDQSKVFMIILMLVGGTAFSTAGGMKVGWFVILYQEFAKRIGTKKSEMQVLYIST
ncbi:K+ transporter family protein [Candidatus Nitrososphaera gargensis Ga9.2]|uniref:K+ transporter family protein n=1 Tax=Nitrososphaera gargensis (strain Ga9.2) TaxID=1237085 RepID=K0IK49_NITGG